MSFLTLLFVLMIAWFVYHLVRSFNARETNKEKLLRKMEYGKSIGLFALITGILGQLVGFRAMFFAIEKAGDINPALVYAGINVTMIVTIYGIVIYLISILLWFVLSNYVERK